MSRALIVRRAGPGLTLQDCGRPGYMGFGLSRGGAADRQAPARLRRQEVACGCIQRFQVLPRSYRGSPSFRSPD